MGLFSTENSHNRRHDERFVKLFIPSDSEVAGKHETSTTNHSQGMTYQLPCYSLFKCWIWLQYQISETFSVAQALWKQEQTISRLSQKQSPFTQAMVLHDYNAMEDINEQLLFITFIDCGNDKNILPSLLCNAPILTSNTLCTSNTCLNVEFDCNIK